MSLPGAINRFVSKETPSSKDVTAFHQNSDLDGSPKAQHHTLGPGPNQAAAGNHSHDAGGSSALAGYSPSNHDHSGLYLPANVPWIAMPYSGGWADLASGYVLGKYRLIGDTVECTGMMKHATVTTTGTFATLPVGYRPTGNMQFMCQGSGGGPVDVRLNNVGVLSIQAYVSNATGAGVSLVNIRFSTTA